MAQIVQSADCAKCRAILGVEHARCRSYKEQSVPGIEHARCGAYMAQRMQCSEYVRYRSHKVHITSVEYVWCRAMQVGELSRCRARVV